MKKITFTLLAILILLFSSCTTFRAAYYADGHFFTSQEEGQFAEPENKPIPAEGKGFSGWSLEGSNGEIYTAWNQQPKGEVRFDAVFEDLPYIEYYVDGALVLTQYKDEFAEPEAPELPVEVSLAGWAPADTGEIITDWSTCPEGVYKINAVIVDNYLFYLNDELWKAVAPWDFGNPGQPEEKLIPRGYTFVGWLASPDYTPYTAWNKAPETLRFDAVLVMNTVDSAMGSNNVRLNFNPHRDMRVLGPVFISETYEIIDGNVKVGGIGYNDIMAAALEKYPEADQVIDIVVDYSTDKATIMYDSTGKILEEDELLNTYPVSVKDVYYRTATYTGIAIDIR